MAIDSMWSMITLLVQSSVWQNQTQHVVGFWLVWCGLGLSYSNVLCTLSSKFELFPNGLSTSVFIQSWVYMNSQFSRFLTLHYYTQVRLSKTKLKVHDTESKRIRSSRIRPKLHTNRTAKRKWGFSSNWPYSLRPVLLERDKQYLHKTETEKKIPKCQASTLYTLSPFIFQTPDSISCNVCNQHQPFKNIVFI